jgi:hypothetical protein
MLLGTHTAQRRHVHGGGTCMAYPIGNSRPSHQESGVRTKKVAFAPRKWPSHQESGVSTKKVALAPRKWPSHQESGVSTLGTSGTSWHSWT